MINRVNIEKEWLRIKEMEREVAYAKQNLSHQEVIAKMQDDREKKRAITTRDLIPAAVDERYQDFWREEQAELEAFETYRLACEAWNKLHWWTKLFTPFPIRPRRRSCCGDH